MALPVLGIALMFVAYGVMWGLGLSGRSASGPPVVLAFEGCAEARPVVEARLSDMGLSVLEAEAFADGFRLTVPGTGDRDVDGRLAMTLASPSQLEVRAGDGVLADTTDILEATVRLDVFMAPYVLLRLDEDAAERVKQHVREVPRGTMTAWVDGKKIGFQSNSNPVAVGELEIDPQIEDHRTRMQAVAAWSVTLDHPLPCSLTVK